MKRLLLGLLFVVLLFSLGGCSTARFLLQAGNQQLAILNRARPISEVVADERTPPRLKRLLSRIERIKSFGEANALKKTRNYTQYVQLDRPAAVWVVSAAEELRFQSRQWSFPIIGSVPYLGYFDLDNAKEFAGELKAQGWDVYVRGAGAYSTLGWFPDPVLSSMIPEAPTAKVGSNGDEAMGALVNIVLHESVHATYYLKGQTPFNESLASFVADHLTQDFLAQEQDILKEEIEAYQKAHVEHQKRELRLVRAYSDLSALYASEVPREEKLAKKAAYIKALQDELSLKREPNNAMLIQFKTYNTGFGVFEDIFTHCQKSWPAFWKAFSRVSEKSFPREQMEKSQDWEKALEPLRTQPCR